MECYLLVRNTGQAMTEENFRKYWAIYTEEIRAAFPDVEIVHNMCTRKVYFSIHSLLLDWWLPSPTTNDDEYVRRCINASSHVRHPFGFSDSGLLGNPESSIWSLKSFHSWVDTMHSLGFIISIFLMYLCRQRSRVSDRYRKSEFLSE